MSDAYQRPWWLLVTKSAELVTTIEEETQPGEHVFIIRGAPVVQGLAWLTWGPVGALVGVVLLTTLAILFDLREQTALMKVLFIGAFLLVPALIWVGLTLLVTLRSQKYLQVVREAETQICTICLRQNEGQIRVKRPTSLTDQTIAYADIQQAKVTYPIGEQEGKKTRLTLNTEAGPIILLNETLGTQTQKIDLAQKIQQMVDAYRK